MQAMETIETMDSEFAKLGAQWTRHCMDYAGLDRIVQALRGVLERTAKDRQHATTASMQVLSMSMNTPSAHGESAITLDGAVVTDNDFFVAVDAEMLKIDGFVAAHVASLRQGLDTLEADANGYADRVASGAAGQSPESPTYAYAVFVAHTFPFARRWADR